MRLINQTCYSTRDLKKFFTRIAKDELTPEKAKRVRFKIVYAKKGHHTGCAYVGGTLGTLRLPKPPVHAPDHTKIAMVVAHEMAHLRGMEHKQMRGQFRYHWTNERYRTIYTWANDLPLSFKELKADPKPTKSETVTGKLAHAEKMLEKNITKLKRTEALVKKWSAKVKYYQKRNLLVA